MSDRVPYAERDAVILRHCTCHYVWSEGADGQPRRGERYFADYRCPLHGKNANPAPF